MDENLRASPEASGPTGHSALLTSAIPTVDRQRYEQLLERLKAIWRHCADVEARFASSVREVHPLFRESARNLLHYLALRSEDLRQTQRLLAGAGLSSLGRSESHVAASLEATTNAVRRLLGECREDDRLPDQSEFERGVVRLQENSRALFGEAPVGRRTWIMVTLPSAAAEDRELVRRLVASGMNSARINCAHDHEPAWERMIANVRSAAADLGRECRILMDLAGPKLRTGAAPEGPRVVHWRPHRDDRGRTVAPASSGSLQPECRSRKARQRMRSCPSTPLGSTH